ncbi:hypothetical protein S40288_10738 [Stachybotrys chartarum IBT 40288]|nr:hypothetical protein S40288_10738 [Stachybotrys chartarum IBT 40288]
MVPLTRSSRSLTASSRILQTRQRGQSQRLFHQSTKTKAVEVASPQVSSLFRHIPAVPFMAPHAPRQKQLNVLEQAHKPEFYETVAKIMRLREKYVEERCVFVESRDMIPIVLGLGACPEDLARMETVSDNLYHDPTLPFRRSRNGRFCIDFDTRSLRRLEFQPFALSVEEDFKRYDSGKIRRFDEVQDELQLNSVFQALFVFKAMMLDGVAVAPRPKLEYGINKWVCTLFNLRTVTNQDILGEPALEGVHSDGVDHTMTTYLGCSNMAPHSAATFMHDMSETTGIQLGQINPERVLARVQHRNLLDTLMIVDHERKHSLSPVYQIDKTEEATRDMLVFFTRKPVEKSHISGSIDSLVPHRDLPMEVPLFVPGRR